MEQEKTVKGSCHFVPPKKKCAVLRHTPHTLKKTVFDNALKEAEKLGLSVSEYLSKVLDATHDLN